MMGVTQSLVTEAQPSRRQGERMQSNRIQPNPVGVKSMPTRLLEEAEDVVLHVHLERQQAVHEARHDHHRVAGLGVLPPLGRAGPAARDGLEEGHGQVVQALWYASSRFGQVRSRATNRPTRRDGSQDSGVG